MMRNEVHISADMNGTGIEIRVSDDLERHLVMIPPEELGLSQHLIHQIQGWQRWFDAVLYFFDFGASFEALGDKFDEVGCGLGEQVAAELGPEYRVLYGPQGGWCLRIGYGQSIVIQL